MACFLSKAVNPGTLSSQIFSTPLTNTQFMTGRTKIAIIGADQTSFHIFQTVYKSDDRYEVVCFIDFAECVIGDSGPSKYPPELSGSGYPSGIPIIHVNPFQNLITDRKIEKCVISPLGVTTSMYLYLASQCLAADCSVISHALEYARLPPPKPLVSFFADTQFDGKFLMALVEHYQSQKLKPMVVFPAPLDLFACDVVQGRPYVTMQKADDVHKFYRMGNRDKELCEQLVAKCPVSYVWDLDRFAVDSARDASYDLILFAGWNSLPVYFQSHLMVFACDDFTFGENFSEHPSWVMLRQADVIFVAGIRGDEASKRIAEQSKATVVSVPVEFTAQNQSCYRGRPCLLLDDWYPVIQCNAVESISMFLATHFGIKPISIAPFLMPAARLSDSPIYGEPTEKHWPALIVPDSSPAVTSLMEQTTRILEEQKIDCHLIVSSTRLPPGLKPSIPLMEFKFTMKIQIPKDALNLPAAAFVRPRGR